MTNVQLFCGDCLEVMRGMPDNSVDAIVSDPPAGISFMNLKFDSDRGGRDAWIAWMTKIASECLRLLKPGGHALVWALPRTAHWTATAWEDAGFECRDKLYHLFGQGFPKGLDVSKQIDKHLGKERETLGTHRPENRNAYGKNAGALRCTVCGNSRNGTSCHCELPTPATPEAAQWQGWNVALKPAVEEWILLRKPLSEPTVAANVMKHGTGALNIGATRIEITDGAKMARNNAPGANGWKNSSGGPNSAALNGEPSGRWPANVAFSEDAAALLDEMSGVSGGGSMRRQVRKRKGFMLSGSENNVQAANAPDNYADRGGASRFFLRVEHDTEDELTRFFYCPKASKRDRDEGLEERNHHPCVKNTTLMRWLCRLICPPGGTIIDPFLGSGSTGKAAVLEGFSFVGIDHEAEYVELAEKRIAYAQSQATEAQAQPRLFEETV